MSNELTLEQMKAELQCQRNLLSDEISLALKKQSSVEDLTPAQQALIERQIETVAQLLMCQVLEKLINELTNRITP